MISFLRSMGEILLGKSFGNVLTFTQMFYHSFNLSPSFHRTIAASICNLSSPRQPTDERPEMLVGKVRVGGWDNFSNLRISSVACQLCIRVSQFDFNTTLGECFSDNCTIYFSWAFIWVTICTEKHEIQSELLKLLAWI